MQTRRDILRLLGGAALAGTLPACSRDESSAIPNPEPPPPTPVEAPPVQAPDNLHFQDIREISKRLRNGSLSPVELTQRMLDRIYALDGRLKSYATLTADRALSAAIRAREELANGDYRGPLHGVPVAVKDLVYTKGTRTMSGSAVYRDFVPDFDATVVRRLEDAGAVLLGKLNLTEGAMAGYHPEFDIPVNPWDERFWPGASSSGSGVAVAAGLCFAALGTATGGSIRFPTMANGIVGLKPTYGRVSRHGVMPLSPSMDHVGPMTRRVADSALVLQALAGHDPEDPTSLAGAVPEMIQEVNPGIAGLTIGYDRAFATAGTDAGLAASIDEALATLEQLGARLVEMTMPEGSDRLLDIWLPICAFEARRAHAESLETRPDEFGPYFRDFLELGATITEEQYAAASAQRDAFTAKYLAMLDGVDAAVLPAGGVTFPLDPSVMYGDGEDLEPLFAAVQMQHTIPANFAGTPSLTLPCGFADDLRPYTLQLLGPRLSEPKLCQIGHAYEAATLWHQRHPKV
ncbi:MAG: amidase [Xanthomonadales bacterium]|nr:amidase [Xanthomonadales bacterium]